MRMFTNSKNFEQDRKENKEYMDTAVSAIDVFKKGIAKLFELSPEEKAERAKKAKEKEAKKKK